MHELKRLETKSKKTRLVDSLKEAILSGSLQSGESIVETRMAQQVGVAQGVLREALIELEHQGFVQRTPYSGTRVTTLTHGDARDIFDVRLLLEPFAFTEASRRIGPEEVNKLRDTLAETFKAVEASDLRLFFDLHLQYRRRIWQLAGNKYLEQSLERIVSPLYALYLIRGTFSGTAPVMDTARICVENQNSTIDALARGEGQEVERLVISFLNLMRGEIGKSLLRASEESSDG